MLRRNAARARRRVDDEWLDVRCDGAAEDSVRGWSHRPEARARGQASWLEVRSANSVDEPRPVQRVVRPLRARDEVLRRLLLRVLEALRDRREQTFESPA